MFMCLNLQSPWVSSLGLAQPGRPLSVGRGCKVSPGPCSQAGLHVPLLGPFRLLAESGLSPFPPHLSPELS